MQRDSSTRFSTLGFFHQTIPHRALIHALKPFRIWLRIRRENRLYSNVNDTAEMVSAVSITPLKWFQRCHWHRWNHGDGKVKNFTETSTTGDAWTSFSVSAVSITPLNRFWRLSKRLSRRSRCHMQNGFNLLIRDIYGVDWWKKPRSKISCYCPFNENTVLYMTCAIPYYCILYRPTQRVQKIKFIALKCFRLNASLNLKKKL
jgi:hypothetical protein